MTPPRKAAAVAAMAMISAKNGKRDDDE